MKFLMAIITYLALGAVLGVGMYLAAKGQPWFLVLGGLIYLGLFAKTGCLDN